MTGKFWQVDHEPSPGHYLVTQMLTRDLFGVANLFVLMMSYWTNLRRKLRRICIGDNADNQTDVP